MDHRDKILRQCDEIAETLVLLRHSQDWHSAWRRDMARLLDQEPVDWMAVTQAALRGFQAATNDAHRVNQELSSMVTGLKQARSIVPAGASSVLIPEETVSVTNSTHQLILFVIGKAGVGRKWRIVPLVQELAREEYGTAPTDRTVQNGFSQLLRDGFIAYYQHHEEPVRYKLGRGPGRGLYLLADRGKLWYENIYDEPPVKSELLVFVPRHKGVQHAVDILEARDMLRGFGLQVRDAPEAVLLTDDEWGPRSEPDLALRYDGYWWPVEVQREVRRRNNDKWRKLLAEEGRLILILESAKNQASQARILREATLPSGRILLTNLRTLQSRLEWEEIER